jgi:hypothetical protein
VRKEDASLRGDLEAADGERMQQPEEDEHVVRPMLTLDVLEEAAAPRPYLTHPAQFVGATSRPFTQPAAKVV